MHCLYSKTFCNKNLQFLKILIMGVIWSWFQKKSEKNIKEDLCDIHLWMDEVVRCRNEIEIDGPVVPRYGQSQQSNFQNEKIQQNQNILKELSFEFGLAKIPQNKVYTIIDLKSNSQDYRNVHRLFFTKNKKCFRVRKIEKLYNPYLIVQYNMKKNNMKEKNAPKNKNVPNALKNKNVPVKEKQMFHGIQKNNLDSICKFNLNWRFHGSNVGNKFGQGVSFSPFAYYATYYSDSDDNKLMILANVLIGECCKGNKNTIIPEHPYDTSTDEHQQVYVKYEDDEFYPAYIIHYEGKDVEQERRRSEKEENREKRPPKLTLNDFLI